MKKEKRGYWVTKKTHEALRKIKEDTGKDIGDVLDYLIEIYYGESDVQKKLEQIERLLKQSIAINRSTEDGIDIVTKMLNSEYAVTETVAGYYDVESNVLKESREARKQEKDKLITQRVRDKFGETDSLI